METLSQLGKCSYRTDSSTSPARLHKQPLNGSFILSSDQQATTTAVYQSKETSNYLKFHWEEEIMAQNTRDQYGNPVSQTDQYGNPVPTAAGTINPDAPVVGSTAAGTEQKHHGVLHRSGGSSSSSSSEDDGHGGRRKKGLKEKIKEKLPGGHREDQAHATAPTTTPGGDRATVQAHEKKGMMEKIKEKLPGPGHHN